MDITPRIASVTPTKDHRLRVVFVDGQVRLFDVTPYMQSDFFSELRDPEYFAQVAVVQGGGGVEWPNEQDLSRDTLYLKGEPLPAPSFRSDEKTPAS